MSNQVVLLHCHIFKNGGTTIDDILKRNFDVAAVQYESSDDQFLTPDVIVNVIKGQPSGHVCAVSSHKLGLPVPSHESIKFIPLIMLREPLDRLGSMYSFYKRQKEDINHECILAKQNSFKGFVEILLESGVDSSFANIQAQFFLGNYFPPKHPSEETWGALSQTLDNTPCVGLLERFDDSMILWEEYLRAYFPKIDLAYSRENVSHDRSQDISDRLNEVKQELGGELVAKFEKRNTFDYRLHGLVRDRIENEAITLSDFAEKQKRFKSRVIEIALNSISENKCSKTGRGEAEGEEIVDSITCSGIGGRRLHLARIPTRRDLIHSTFVHIVGCALFDCGSGRAVTSVKHGQQVEIVVVAETTERIGHPIVGVTVRNDSNDIMFAMNSFFSEGGIEEPETGRLNSYSFVFKVPSLNSGTYSITPAFARGTQENHVSLSCVENAFVFVVPRMVSQRLPGALYVDDFEVRNN